MVSATLMAVLAHAHAAAACDATVLGAATDAWRDAAALAARAGDCERLEVDVEVDGSASLTFLTADGRTAVRSLRHADELVPTVQALSVAVPPPEPEPIAARLTPAPAAERGVAPQEADHEPTHAPAARERGADLALALGFRGGSGGFMSPVLSGSAALAIARFRLAVGAGWEAQYLSLTQGRSVKLESTALVASLGLGRWIPLRAFALGGGVHAHFARVVPSQVKTSVEMPVVEPGMRSFLQWRAGADMSVVYPRRAGIRFRITLEGDAVVAQRPEPTRHLLPLYALAGLMAVEMAIR